MSGTFAQKPYVMGESFRPPGAEVDFFLRLHRHLPDEHCGESALSACKYAPDGIPINVENAPVKERQKDPQFRKREQAIQDAQQDRYTMREAADGAKLTIREEVIDDVPVKYQLGNSVRRWGFRFYSILAVIETEDAFHVDYVLTPVLHPFVTNRAISRLRARVSEYIKILKADEHGDH
jgi:hypothetical protein